jgi:hypothetical protein
MAKRWDHGKWVSRKPAKKRYTDAQRAAYWKKQYLALLKSRSR